MPSLRLLASCLRALGLVYGDCAPARVPNYVLTEAGYAFVSRSAQPRDRRIEARVNRTKGQRVLQAVALLADGHSRSPGTLAFWGSDTAHTEDTLLGLQGDGLQLDRARFDARLRTAAHAAGAQVIDGARLRLLERGDAHTPHTLELRIGEAAPQRVQARWLIDASGRSATLAHALGAQRITHDRLLAFHQRLIGGAATDRDGSTWVEAVADGWWCSVLLPSGERLIAFLSDFSGGDGAAERRGLLTGVGL